MKEAQNLTQHHSKSHSKPLTKSLPRPHYLTRTTSAPSPQSRPLRRRTTRRRTQTPADGQPTSSVRINKIYKYMYVYICMCMCMCICIYVCICVYMYGHTCMYMYVYCVCVCMHITCGHKVLLSQLCYALN